MHMMSMTVVPAMTPFAVCEFLFMKIALKEAQKALSCGEFPVGSVLVHRKQLIATGSRIGTAHGGHNEIDHAEMLALRQLSMTNIELIPGVLRAESLGFLKPFARVRTTHIGKGACWNAIRFPSKEIEGY